MTAHHGLLSTGTPASLASTSTRFATTSQTERPPKRVIPVPRPPGRVCTPRTAPADCHFSGPAQRIKAEAPHLFSNSFALVPKRGVMSSQCLCRLCGQRLTQTFVDLGMSPLCESYVSANQLDQPEIFYPLHVRQCSSCLLVQLPAYVSGEDIFSDYAYFSSYSDSWVAHAKRFADSMIERLRLSVGQPRGRGGEQRRIPAPAFPGRGRPRPGNRAGKERRRGGPVPRH